MEYLKLILKFLPRFQVINQDEGGLFLRRGKYTRTIGAGVYFLLPVVDEIVDFMTAMVTLDTQSMSVTTKDRKDLLVSWSATYLVSDPLVAYLQTDDIQTQIAASLSQRLVAYINEKEYHRIGAQGIVAYMTSQSFRESFKQEWGIKIVGFYLRDLVSHRTFRLVDNKELDF